MKPEEFIKVLEEMTPKDMFKIDVTKQRTKVALHTILIFYYQSKSEKSPQMWQRVTSKKPQQEFEKDFFENLMKNHDLAAILIALYKDPHKSIEVFSKAIKGKNDQNLPELLDLLTMEATLATHIKIWLNSVFKDLKSKAPGVYYSFLYHSLLRHRNDEVLDEILKLFPDKTQLEKLRDLKGKEFREFYSDSRNIHFWHNISLITSQYYDRANIIDLIAEKLLDGTSDKERSQIIANILNAKSHPFKKELEVHLFNRLSKPDPTVRLVSTSGGTQLAFAEFEVLSPSPEHAPRVSEQAPRIPSHAPRSGPSK